MSTTRILNLPPIKIECCFVFDEKQHSTFPSSHKYRESIDHVDLTKTDFPLWSMTYYRKGTTPQGRTSFGPKLGSSTPIIIDTATIDITLPQDLVDSIDNDRTQSYTSTVTDGITLPSQTLTMTTVTLILFRQVFNRLDGSTASSSTKSLVSSGSYPVTGDTVDLTINYRPLTKGNIFYYCFSYQFNYTIQLACPINGS